MAQSREQIMGALYNLLSGGQEGPNGKVPGIVAYSRRVILPAEAANGQIDLPCLMLWRLHEKTEVVNDVLTRRKWPCWIVVIIKNTDKTVAGDTILNPILDGIEAALAPSGPGYASRGVQNLSNLVQWVKIDGDIQMEPGDSDPNGVGGLVVPLTIMVP